MQILIVTPGTGKTPLGNQVTARRWAHMLRQLGHQVRVTAHFQRNRDTAHDCLVALHAFRSAKSVSQFAARFPQRPIIVGLTGTDLNRNLQSARSPGYRSAQQSLRAADRIVLLQEKARQQLPRSVQGKCRTIFQSATTLRPRPRRLTRCFEVVVAGHLRAEKDPFLAARAARLIPASSRIQINHIGFALSESYAVRAEQESATNPRYRWEGGVAHWQARRRIARSRLLVLTSRSEGGPSVFAEAILNDVPILSTRISTTCGMLGNDYPGLFPVGDRRKLARLLERSESDPGFYRKLLEATRRLKPRFAPRSELAAWRKLLAELNGSQN
ncbi:MAG: TIGR04348 family glycosyltransferase [Mariniblastus sp.]|nr:TIGR04348 family glycosyltransferase [Mariniblastus sp.]